MNQAHLVIVESPAKAKTIKKYLGKGYEVTSSMGHVVDLPDKGMWIDITHDFAPTYEVDSSKKSLVTALRKAAKKMQVWLATDEDREGEAIARHLARELELDVKKTPRIVFHEITQSAITEAINHPRVLDLALVDAQQARRILDRLVWYELSPVLRKKVKTGLSAGRVQSVAVRLIVEREREITSFVPEERYALEWTFATAAGHQFRAQYKEKVKKSSQVKELLELRAGKQFVVSDITTQPGTKNPPAPFTTSSLQQEASRRLGYSVSRTMQLAQRLYESGHITYMRTDSVALSKQALGAAAATIKERFGEKYHQIRTFKTKSASAQEAHEAIRPTHFAKERAGEDESQKKLYHLIRQRTLASQMASAKVERTQITLIPETTKKTSVFIAKGEVVLFDWFLRLRTKEEQEDAEDQGLPVMNTGEQVNYQQIIGLQTFSKPSARFTEAMLVKTMEELGIGRPSTYAPTISTIQNRGYVERRDHPGEETLLTQLTLKAKKITEKNIKKTVGAFKQRLVPTDVGMVVNDFLCEHFPHILDYQFTAEVEEEFDHIAAGKIERQKMIKKFYGPFHEIVTSVTETAQRASGERILGKDPKTGKSVLVRLGRFWPLVQIGNSEDPDKQFASLRPGTHLETISLEDALESFKLPRLVGERNGKEIKANIGRFGPYVQRGSTFASLPKGTDPMQASFDEAVSLLEAKIKKDAENTVGTFLIDGKEAIVKKGRWGYFVSYKRKKFKVPKDIEPKKITSDEVKRIVGSKS